MFIGNGVVLGIKSHFNSSYFFFVIINFNINSMWNQKSSKRDITSCTMEEISITAHKLGELANYLRNKLLE